MLRNSRAQSGRPPAYQYHISGQARVKIEYTDYLLGEYGSRDSRKLYTLLMAEYDKLGKAPDKECNMHLCKPRTQQCEPSIND